VSTIPAAKLTPVSMTLAANFATSFASVVDTGCVNNTGGKIGAGIIDMVANNGNNIRLLNLKAKMYL
jgi:hypothetical protein